MTASKARFELRLINAEAAVDIRWPVLRAGLPRESASFPGDDAPATRHLGAFSQETLAGVASVYRADFPDQPEAREAWQLRGMAVLTEWQRRGVGEALIEGCVREVSRAGGRLLWCNARVPAAAFYAKHGWRISGEEFEIPTAGPHFRMWRPIEA